MSLNSLPKIDQKEYLKRYLSGDKVKKKKKDKKHKKSKEKVRIIDDDVYDVDNGPKIDEELLLTGDDAPQIVGEYVEDLQLQAGNVPRWKSIAVKDEPEDENDIKSNINKGEEDLWGRKASEIKIKQEFSPSRNKGKRVSPDPSSPRRKDKKKKSRTSPGSSPSLRKERKNSGNFLSPKRKPFNSSRHRSITPDNAPIRKERKSRFDKSRSPDQSPARRRKSLSSDQSPPRRRNHKVPDQSPPRRSNYANCPSPIRRRRDSDQSPPRNKRTSPARRRKNSDQSPPRTHNREREESPRRRRRDSDQSPPRSRKKSDRSSPRRRNNSDQELSRHRRNSDQSPPRRRRNSDQSPPRRGRKRSPSDSSPPRRNRRDSSDQSPPRKCIGERLHSPPSTFMKKEIKQEKLSPPPQRKSRWERNSDSPPPTHKPKTGKTLDGKTAGLQDAKALKAETNERCRQEEQLFEKMSADITGRNAEVKVRSTGRQGRRAREAREEDPEERRRKEEYEQKKKEEYERLSKGIKQIEDYRKRKAEMEHESNKPLARYSNDDDLERHLKEQERAEDPMLEYMRKKRKEKEKDSGKPQKPQYEGPFPENRFGIRPGYRWDGVDRSNGYEKKWFDVQNAKKATQDEAYKYSVEDM